MDIEKSFTFPFEDKDWGRKLGLGALITFIPILNFAWSGYLVGIIRNVMNDVTEPLPTWDDLGRKFNEGLILVGAGLIYALPIIIVLCMPLTILALSGRFSEISNVRGVSEAGGAYLACILCILALYSIVLSAIYPVILVIFSREGTFASCFKLREAMDLIAKNMAPFLTAWGLSLGTGFGVGLVVSFISVVFSWIPCLGQIVSLALSLVSGAYITVVYAHLFGQFGRIAFGQNQLSTLH